MGSCCSESGEVDAAALPGWEDDKAWVVDNVANNEECDLEVNSNFLFQAECKRQVIDFA